MATVTSKGQITLPKKVRDALGLVPGSRVEFVIEPDAVRLLRPPIADEVWTRWVGYLRDQVDGKSTDQIVEELRGERASDP